MTERKLTDVDRAAMEILELKTSNLALQEQMLAKQVNEFNRAKADNQHKRGLFHTYLQATYGFDPAREAIKIEDGTFVPTGAPPEPEAAAVAEQAPPKAEEGAPVNRHQRRRLGRKGR